LKGEKTAMFQEHDIYMYIKERGGKASMKEIVKNYGVDKESERLVK